MATIAAGHCAALALVALFRESCALSEAGCGKNCRWCFCRHTGRATRRGGALGVVVLARALAWISHGFAHLSVRALRAVDAPEQLLDERHARLPDALEDDCLLCPGVLHALALGSATQGGIADVDGPLQFVAPPLQSRVAPRLGLAAPNVLVDIHELLAQLSECTVALWRVHG